MKHCSNCNNCLSGFEIGRGAYGMPHMYKRPDKNECIATEVLRQSPHYLATDEPPLCARARDEDLCGLDAKYFVERPPTPPRPPDPPGFFARLRARFARSPRDDGGPTIPRSSAEPMLQFGVHGYSKGSIAGQNPPPPPGARPDPPPAPPPPVGRRITIVSARPRLGDDRD